MDGHTRTRAGSLKTVAHAITWLVAVLPLALGGVHAEVVMLSTLGLVGALAWTERKRAHVWQVSPLFGAVALLWLGTALMLIPLPRSWVWALSPKAALFLDVQDVPSPWRLGLDHAENAQALVALTGYLAAVLVAPHVFGGVRHRRQLYRAIAVAGMLVVGVGVAHALLDLNRTYGSFGPARPHWVASFVNSNHTAAFLGFASFVALGLWFTAKRKRTKNFYGVSSAILALAMVGTLSRGAVLAYALVLSGLGVWLVVSRSFKQGAWLLGAAAVLTVGAFVLWRQLLAREVLSLFEEQGYSKLDLYRYALSAGGDFPVGAGAGSFAALQAHYSPHGPTATYTHVENGLLQLFSDHGFLLGSAIAALFAFAFVQAWRGAKHETARLFALAGVTFLVLQNMLDFSWTLPALGLPMLLVLATHKSPARHGAKENFVGAMLCAAVAVALVPLYLVARHTVDHDTKTLERTLSQSAPKPPPASVSELIAVRPADSFLPLFVADYELRNHRVRSALHYINRSQNLSPNNAAGHRLAGRALLALGKKSQAFLEYRAALQLQPTSVPALSNEVWTLTHSPQALVEIATDITSVRLHLGRQLLGHKAYSLALPLFDDPSNIQSLLGKARALEGEGNMTEAVLAAEQALLHFAQDAAPYTVLASLYFAQHNTEAAYATLDNGLRNTSQPASLLLQKARYQTAQKQHRDAITTAQTALRFVGDAASQAQTNELLGVLSEREQRAGDALRYYERARDSQPHQLHYWLQVARARKRVGDVRGARNELDKARLEFGDKDEIAKVAEGLR